MLTTYYKDKDKEQYKEDVMKMKPDNTTEHMQIAMEQKGLSIFGYKSIGNSEYKTPEALRYKATEYFTQCIEQKEPILLGMLYIHLGVNRNYFNYLSNKHKEQKDQTSIEYLSVIEQIHAIIEGNLEKALVTNKQINGLSLVLANRYNWNTSKSQNTNDGTITLDLAGLHQQAQQRRAETQVLIEPNEQ